MKLDGLLPGDGPVYRQILAVDIEGHRRTDQVKGELRRILYDLLGRALETTGIGAHHLEPSTDRGDGVLILIEPHDDMPKTLLLGRLVPILTGLLAEHNAAATRPELAMRLRAVVHAGEIYQDNKGFYGDDIDAAFRLLEAQALKKALKNTSGAPLILIVSEEIFHGIVEQGYPDPASFKPLVRVRVGSRRRRGWVQVPVPEPTAQRQNNQDLTRVPIPGAVLSAIYQALEHRLAETEGPYDVEAGLAKLKAQMSTERTGL